MQRLKKDDQFMVTASMKEKDSFARLADEWWVQDGEFKSLHDINPIRLTYVRDQICEHYRLDKNNINCLNKISILDVGCGGGLICEPMVRLGADVTGIDPVPMMQEALELLKNAPNAALLWASPREVLNVYQAEAIGCHIITATNDILKKLELNGKNLDVYSQETVQMFFNDAQAAGFNL